MTDSLRIRGGTVVTLDPQRRILRADVYVRGGRIEAIAGPRRPTRRTLDATGMLVIPGMINLHDHLRDLTPGIRLGEGLKLDDFLMAHWRLSESSGKREFHLGAGLGAARLLKAGVTTVVDHVYPFHKQGLAQAAVAGYSTTGIRWFMARGIMTRPYRPICESATDAFRAIERLIDTTVPAERLFVAPVSFRQSTKSDFARSRRFADRHGLKLYTHVAETPAEIAQVREKYGSRPVQLLHQVGFGGEDTVLVHCVYLSKAEIRTMAAKGTHVVHCPTNHMKLAKGVTPVPALLEAGVNVGMGIDTMDDLFSETRQELLLQGLHHSNPAVVSPQTALEMATARGAVALGLGDELGTIEVGKKADLACVEARSLHMQPMLDPVWTLVHRGHGQDVRHVVVDGRVVVKDAKLIDVDEAALIEEAQQVAAAYLRRAGIFGEGIWRV